MFFALYLIFVCEAVITYDSNTYEQFSDLVDSNFICVSTIYTITINFAGIFANIPRVAIIPERIDLETNIDYQFDITSVTTQWFSVRLQCLNARVYKYQFKWFAIDDIKMEVINCFNVINPAEMQTFSHSNPNVIYGFVSLLSFKLTGAISFNLTIQSLTSSSVTTIISNLANLGQIGFQIILGVDDMFNNYTAIETTDNYISSLIVLEPNNYFFAPFIGFSSDNSDNIRLRKIYTTVANNITLQLETWYASYINNTHIEIQIPQGYISVPQAFRISHLNIRTLEDYSTDQQDNFIVYFEQVDRQYSAIETTKLYIDIPLQVLNIDIYVKCSKNKKIIAKFNFCGTCKTQAPFEQTRYCYGLTNAMKFLTRFSSTAQFIKVLTMEITETSLKISQLCSLFRYKVAAQYFIN